MVTASTTGTLLLGFVLTVFFAILVAYLVVSTGALPANANARPSKLESWIARTSLRAAIRREAPKGANPVPASNGNLLAGMKLYLTNCAVCHGVADGKATNIAHGLYQRPPQLASDGVEGDPAGVTYWKVYHGIRLTGMPSFAATLSENQIWQVTAFLQHMNRLPATVRSPWRRARLAEALALASLQAQSRQEAPTHR